MARAGRRRLPFLTGWEKVGWAYTAANASSSKASKVGAVARARRVRSALRRNTGNVCSRSYDFRLNATIVFRPKAGEADNVIRVVGPGVGHTTAIRASEWIDILGRADRYDILSSSRGTGGV